MKESQSRVKKRSEQRDDLETIKAAAWAVFQHNNGGGSNTNRHLGAALVPQGPTRFKIEAQMKNELERIALAKQALPRWDAGSTLFDKYELDSVVKHFDFAFQSVEKQQRLSSEDPKGNDDHAADPESDWLEAVEQSQRFRGSYLESVDESLPLANESPLKPKISLELFDGICKDVHEVVPQGKMFKSMQLMLTPNRWNMLNGRRCSFDISPGDDGHQKESKQSRKSKLLAIFKSKSKDGARVMPDDLRTTKTKTKTKASPRRKSGGDPHESDSSDEYPVKPAMAFSRAVRLSSDMSNPNAKQGLRDHLRHGSLSYGQCAAPPARARRKGSYSLNVTSPAQSPRRSMLDGSREDLQEEFRHEYHHHYHHHHHHIDGDDDYELTVQDIERRASRKSFEEMAAHRLSMEDHPSAGALKVPRNSLESLFFVDTPTPGSKLFL